MLSVIIFIIKEAIVVKIFHPVKDIYYTDVIEISSIQLTSIVFQVQDNAYNNTLILHSNFAILVLTALESTHSRYSELGNLISPSETVHSYRAFSAFLVLVSILSPLCSQCPRTPALIGTPF